MKLTEYLKQYGEIQIDSERKSFHSNGKNFIGGKFIVKDFKKMGMI